MLANQVVDELLAGGLHPQARAVPAPHHAGRLDAQPGPRSPIAHASAVCADYPNQAAAQRAADTRDADGDGIYCESLPCPCSSAAGGGTGDTTPAPKPKTSCTKPHSVQNITFSSTKYPTIRQHFLSALHKGWPRILVLNRPGAAARRARLLEDVPTHRFPVAWC